MTQRTFIIVGAGLAGAKAAEELRERGFDGRVLLIGSEPERPYERPPLTKDYLRGESPREQAYVHPAAFYAEHAIELETGTTVVSLEPGAARITLDDGRSLHYDRLLLATGAEPRMLEIPGAELDGVHTAADAGRLRRPARAPGRRRARRGRRGRLDRQRVRGVRAPARARGDADRPRRAPERADLRARDRGVLPRRARPARRRAAAGRRGRGVRGRSPGRARAHHLGAPRRLRPRRRRCRGAAAGGAGGRGRPAGRRRRARRRAPADGGPRRVRRGRRRRARHPFYGEPIRVEHWYNALHQGPAAAAAMLGDPVAYDRIPYFFSDQYDVGMEYSGYAPRWDEVVFRGDRADGAFIAFWLLEDRVVAAMNVNIWDVNDQLQALIRAGGPVDRGALGDPGTSLEALAARAGGAMAAGPDALGPTPA